MNKGGSFYNIRHSSFNKQVITTEETHNKSMNIHKKSTKTLRLKSNTLFAFQDDDIYSNICNIDEVHDAFWKNDWVNNSNFYTSNIEKSNLWLQINNEEKEEINKHLEDSVCSISTEMQKNLDFLNEIYEDDLNEAKLSLEELLGIDDECQNCNNSSTTPIVYCNESETNGKVRSCNSFFKEKLINPKFNSNNKNTYSENNDFTTTQSFDFSQQTLSNNNYSNFHYQGSSQNLFNKSNKFPLFQQGYNYPNNSNKKYTAPFNNSNILLNNNVNYSNAVYRNAVGQNSFSIEAWQLNTRQIKENINNRSISQYGNKNLNSIMNFQSEEKYIIDNVDKLLTDQNGCRILQKKLDEKNKEFMLLFYEKIKFKLSSIINNQFGNYLMQKFIECCLMVDINYLVNLIDNIKGSLLIHSNDPYGSRVIQKLLDLINCNNKTNYFSLFQQGSGYKIIETLFEFAKNQIFSLIIDTNGNHVFQKILILTKKFNVNSLFDEVKRNIIDIAKMKQGACVIQKALEIGNDNIKKSICLELVKHVSKIINDEYGNFLIQIIMNIKIHDVNNKIFDYLIKNFSQLSLKKYSSNVIDKCILFDDGIGNKHRNIMIDHIINNKLIPEVISDQYGNYVIQKALQVSDGLRFLTIIQMIKPCLKTLKISTYGKKIYDNLIFQYGDYLFPENPKRNSSFDKFDDK